MRGVGGGKAPDTALEKEIDASLSALDAFDALDNGPTGTSLPEDDTQGRTGETDQAPSTQDADDATNSHVVHPHTLRDAGPNAGNRPRMQTDPSITSASASASDGPAGVPLTVRGEADVDDPTGASEIGTNDLLESTHSGPAVTDDEDEIVIADDLAEIVDDPSNKDMADENTDAGTGTVPPYRSES